MPTWKDASKSKWLIPAIGFTLIFLLTEHGVIGCGTLTHATIGTRALHYLKDTELTRIGLQNPDSFQAGCAFPDWGYNLGYDSLHDASEAAHWPPFIQSLSETIQRKYPKPWNATTERIIAFVLGQTSHSVADILWHDLSEVRDLTSQGFIRAQANIYFDEVYSVSHTEADVGAEFAMASSTDLSWFATEWFVPTIDIVETYQFLGMNQVTISTVEEGMLLLFSAGQLVAHTYRTFDPVEEFVSPFIQENLFDYFIGGIDDSAQWTGACWPAVKNWISFGPDNRTMCPVEPPTIEDATKGSAKLRHAPRGIYHHLTQRPNFKKALLYFRDFVQIRRAPLDRGTYFSISQPINQILNAMRKVIPTITHTKKPKLADSSDPSMKASYAIHQKDGGYWKNLGADHGDSSKQNSDCIQLGSPSAQAPQNFLKISLDAKYANLGESVVQGDFNGDGQMEMAIGAPGFSTTLGMEQTGAVYVLPVPKDIVGQATKVINATTRGTTALFGSSRASRFGTSLAVVDLNRDGIDDLVVSEPRNGVSTLSYRGKVYIFYGARSGLSSMPSTVVTLESAIGNFTMMGASLNSGDLDGDGYADLQIGNPFACSVDSPCTADNDGIMQSGVLSVFLSSKWTMPTKIDLTKADLSMVGESGYYWFGMGSAVLFNASVTSPLLLVSAPIGNYTNNAVAPGYLLAFDYKTMNMKSTDQSPLSTIYSTVPGAKLGLSFSIGSSPYTTQSKTQYLVVSAPSEIAPQTSQGPMFEAGRIYLTDIQVLKVRQSTDSHSLLAISGTERFGRFGWSTLLSDIDNDGIDDLLVSAPLEANQMGRIYLWKGGTSFPTTSTSALSKHACIQLYESTDSNWARFGQNLATMSPMKGSSKKFLLATAPRDSSTQVESGSITLINL